MKPYNSKIVKGTPIRWDQLRIMRAQSIYRAAKCHPYVSIVSCYAKSNGDEIVRMKLFRLEVPDEPVYDIKEEEEVAIICHKEDVSIPEVYALRSDFPLELPHSNARPFIRPISLCVSDVTFADLRPQFNSYDFLNYIRRWFSLNSINQLHEEDRHLEVFFAASEFCCLLNFPEGKNPYVKYTKKTKLTSTLEFVDKSNATHYMLGLPTEKIYASNFSRIPQNVADLRSIRSSANCSIVDSLLYTLNTSVAGKATKPLLVLLYIVQNNANGKSVSHNLFLIKIASSPHSITQKEHVLSAPAFDAWLNELPAEVALMTGMVSREQNADNNGISDVFEKVSIVGTGTLGSAVIDHFVREGCSKEVAIVDFDFLFPHNLSRHTLPTDKVMASKVRSIKDTYQGIFNQKVTAIEGDLFMLGENERERLFRQSQLVVDLSTSIAVERHLAHKAEPFRRCTAFLNPKGDDIVLLMEDEKRSKRLDLLEMDYYRSLIVDERFSRHLEQTGTVRTNHFSCRSESVILNYENVRILSAIVSSQIRKHFFSGESCLNVWRINSVEGTVSSLPIKIHGWKDFSLLGVTVYLSEAVETEIQKMVETSQDIETGGCLFGSYDRDYNRIYVYYMVAAPTDSIHTPVSFVRGFGGLTQEYERITALTYHQVRYLGEWHSHPNMPNTPSSTDKKQFEVMSKEQMSQDLPFVQMIHGTNGLRVKARM